ncbi:energy-coupling factor ABC transporter ATP-binding protein [Polycladidibacter hongkongensis]|uniref:energy-coupling factor ABC transporter ATP-binding protein n=1 Tax=Polycladidibacter hongkongensis TaxID=1647556 RepID=UPI0008308506|nr:energy-coupling factor ABC transporter ATP-binding protein [Pseudovibrio hongkongensis]
MAACKDRKISFDDVSIARDGSPVVRDFTCELEGERIGIIGRNGSGKSTLIRSINALLPISAGQLSVHGLCSAEDGRALLEYVGFVFQNPDHQIIFPTVLEEVSFVLRQKGLGKTVADKQAFAFLCDHGVGQLADKPILSCSEGQKQYLSILAVLIGEPEVLILDEPFSSLDLRNSRLLARELEQLTQQVIFVSHDLSLLADYDQVLWMEEGRLKALGNAGDVLKDYEEAELGALNNPDFRWASA